MSQENSDSNPFTLNPLYLKAVVEEANLRRKPDALDDEEPALAFGYGPEAEIPQDPPLFSEEDLLKHLAWEDTFAQHERQAEGEGGSVDVPSPVEASKQVIARKQAELDRVRSEIDRLGQAKSAGSADSAARLNELRLQRIAIQMALISGGTDYNDGDIAAIDQEIQALSAAVRRAAGPVNEAELAGELVRLQQREQSLKRGLAQLIDEHNVEVVKQKAEAYVETLRAAYQLQHELLALAVLLPSLGALRRVDLGGQLPRPQGLAVFVSDFPKDLSLSVESIEEAKARLRSELVL